MRSSGRASCVILWLGICERVLNDRHCADERSSSAAPLSRTLQVNVVCFCIGVLLQFRCPLGRGFPVPSKRDGRPQMPPILCDARPGRRFGRVDCGWGEYATEVRSGQPLDAPRPRAGSAGGRRGPVGKKSSAPMAPRQRPLVAGLRPIALTARGAARAGLGASCRPGGIMVGSTARCREPRCGRCPLSRA